MARSAAHLVQPVVFREVIESRHTDLRFHLIKGHDDIRVAFVGCHGTGYRDRAPTGCEFLSGLFRRDPSGPR